MSQSTTRYVRGDYRRVCDTCGIERNISQMWRRSDGLFACSYDEGERNAQELSRGNARQRPFRVRPVPYPKPLDPNYPNTFADDEGALFSFLDRVLSGQVRYEQVTNGAALISDTSSSLLAGGWGCRYLYDLIQENTRPAPLLARANTLLQSTVDFLITRQQGFGISAASTRANDAFYGGFLETGASQWTTNTAAICGLACLYAYRVFGLVKYVISARAAASYLRNVQAIGSAGTNFTSLDSAGTSRLYTGAVTSYVSTVAGFFSDHSFYPSGLLTLEFWNEFKTTDGDQSIGSTGTPTGFTAAPSQLLSTSITDMRNFWLAGTADGSGGTVLTGLSVTTPKEFLNAYPATKANTSPTVTGTGRWEYQDGGASVGTLITSANFAQGLSSLFAYEGQSTQVGAVSDWIRSFTSNSAYATTTTSASVIARATSGTYDPTTAPSTLLLVRDSTNGYASIALNGSSLYDWGAFGLLTRLWATRNAGSWRLARIRPLNPQRRYTDGLPSDDKYDRIALRGKCGLSFQTAFTETVLSASRMVNDAVSAAQFGRNYREARS